MPSVGVPLGRWSDHGNRSRILTIGVTVWSVLTALSGMAQHFWQMIVLRLTVGVGEAKLCAGLEFADRRPVSALQRAPAPCRSSCSACRWATRPVCCSAVRSPSDGVGARRFIVALIPGLLCAIGAAMLHEPKRGGTEVHDIGAGKRDGSPYKLVLSIPTMRWIIASGALHNFNMYAIGGFLDSLRHARSTSRTRKPPATRRWPSMAWPACRA